MNDTIMIIHELRYDFFHSVSLIRDPHTLVRCTPYATKHNDPLGIGTQPFVLKVSPEALIVMDFHAHLLWREVIGFLAGSWDRNQRGKITLS